MRKFRIKDKTYYKCPDDVSADYIIRVVKPTIQVKILGIWFTIKEFDSGFDSNGFTGYASVAAKKLYNALTKDVML